MLDRVEPDLRVLHLLMCVHGPPTSVVPADEVELKETLVIRCRRSCSNRVGAQRIQEVGQLMLVPDHEYGKLDSQVNRSLELYSGQTREDRHGTSTWNVYQGQEGIERKGDVSSR